MYDLNPTISHLFSKAASLYPREETMTISIKLHQRNWWIKHLPICKRSIMLLLLLLWQPMSNILEFSQSIAYEDLF